jgi:hypothetical protein
MIIMEDVTAAPSAVEAAARALAEAAAEAPEGYTVGMLQEMVAEQVALKENLLSTVLSWFKRAKPAAEEDGAHEEELTPAELARRIVSDRFKDEHFTKEEKEDFYGMIDHVAGAIHSANKDGKAALIRIPVAGRDLYIHQDDFRKVAGEMKKILEAKKPKPAG